MPRSSRPTAAATCSTCTRLCPGPPSAGSCSASKAALWSQTNSLRLDLKPRGINVTKLHVGYVDTGLAARIDAPLDRVLPALVAEHSRRYAGHTLRELCQDMHDHLHSVRLVDLLDTAFQQLPKPVTPPQLCYQRLIRGGTHRVRLTEAPGQVAAAMITVTPPGIPVLMPGESVGTPDGPLLRYLTALESFDRRFPAAKPTA